MKTNETMKTNTNPEVTGRLVRGAQRAARATTVVLAVATLAGCEVENPGLVEDESLTESQAYKAMIHGAAAELASSINKLQIMTGHAGREIFSSGQSTPGGFGPIVGAGYLVDNSDVDGVWVTAQAARWIAENALERFADPDNEAPTAVDHVQAYLWAGYANERLGENFCEAVFNNGPKEPNRRYFERAEKHFTDAIAMASGQQLTAAYAGRAQARLWLEKWSEAASDAAQVPLDFVYELPADETGHLRQAFNAIYDGNANRPHRAQSIHHTWFYDYYLETGDPRSAWADDPNFPRALQAMPGYPGGSVLWSFTLKYRSLEDPFRLASGREMVLIRAEALLNAGDWEQAMTLINSIRTSTSRPSPRLGEETESLVSDKTGQLLEPWPASSIEEAWTALKRERAVEMWLEARRMGDLRRWKENNVPGEIDWPDWESISFNFVDNPPSECIPVPRDEIDSNPNF